MMIRRALELPDKSFILLGPRGTGKSTLIKSQIKFSLEINLLKSSFFLPLSNNPSLLHEWIKHLKPGDWVYIDEIQKIPGLLDEVHAAYEDQKLNFALSGSSVRKLRRGGSNLLAGRALQVQLFPLVKKEYQERLEIRDVLLWGTLPLVVVDAANRKETLEAYVETYLRQELIEEGLIRKMEPFIRFLNIAGLYNAQTLNIENIARDSHVGRTTVDKYFEILEETLLGYKLQAFQAKVNKREIQHPKFYLFDTGVARACAGLLGEEEDPVWMGHAFETCMMNEIKAYNSYSKKQKNLFYYRFTQGYEIDLVVETKKKTLSNPGEVILMEFKYSKKWDKRWSEPLEDFIKKSKRKVKSAYCIYLGETKTSQAGVQILHFGDFFKKLHQDEIF